MKIFITGSMLFAILLFTQCGADKKEAETGKPNTPPRIEHVEIHPEFPTRGSQVTLRIDAHDNEGDKITYAVKWFLNGRLVQQGSTFSSDTVKRGDRVFAEITPSDGKKEGKTVRTSIVTFANTQPRITSARISPDTVLSSTDNLTVIGEGYDPDNDPIIWLCYWTLDYSQRIADSATQINIREFDIKKGSHLTAELYASDGDTVSNVYLLEIDVANAHPVIRQEIDSIPYTPDSISFVLPITDPDQDPLTFDLLEAPEGLTIDTAKGIVYGRIEDTTSVQILVRATDSDGAYVDARFTLTPP